MDVYGRSEDLEVIETV